MIRLTSMVRSKKNFSLKLIETPRIHPDISSFFWSNFVRSKTGELGSGECCRGIDSLQNPIYGDVQEFHFPDPFIMRRMHTKFSQCTAYIEG
jgi:hypothetical protein